MFWKNEHFSNIEFLMIIDSIAPIEWIESIRNIDDKEI